MILPMELLTTYQLRNLASRHFNAVQETPGIDKFCSTLDWTLPAHEAFIPDHPLYLIGNENGFVNLAGGFNPRIGRYLQPLEASWCLASPIVGFDLPKLLEQFASYIRSDGSPEWDLLYFSGIPKEGELIDAIINAFRDDHRIGVGHETSRYMASLEGGADGWLSRRKGKFRANIRNALRRADEANVTFEYLDAFEEPDRVYDRILDVERESWKGKSGTGILDGGMNLFYRIMLPRLARRNGLRVLFARKDERDIAFVFGGMFDNQYRGLQMSYIEEHARLSLGNLVQHQMIERLSEQGVGWYDLGSELEYKTRWAEERLETITIWVWRN